MNRYALGSLAVLLPLSAPIAYGLWVDRATATSKRPVTEVAKRPDVVARGPAGTLEIRDWFALGSGCRAIPNKTQNVW